MLNGLMRFFGASKNEDDAETGFEEESGFIWTEHMRIVLAIIFAVVGALFMWWIVA